MTGDVWPTEYADRLRVLWDEGLSCSQISRVLKAEGGNYSRNSVLGKVRRLNLSSRATFSRRGPPTTPVPKPRPVKAAPMPAEPLVFLCPPGTFPADFESCRYPVGETNTADGWQMCGHPGFPWCQDPRKICFQPQRTEASRKKGESAEEYAALAAQQDRTMRRMGL